MESYYNVMKMGYGLLKDDADLLYGTDAKDQAETALHMAGIIDTVYALRKIFETDETEKEDN